MMVNGESVQRGWYSRYHVIWRYCWYKDIRQHEGVIVWWKSIRCLQYLSYDGDHSQYRTMEIVHDTVLAASINGDRWRSIQWYRTCSVCNTVRWKSFRDNVLRYNTLVDRNTVWWRSIRYCTCSARNIVQWRSVRYCTWCVYRWRSIVIPYDGDRYDATFTIRWRLIRCSPCSACNTVRWRLVRYW